MSHPFGDLLSQHLHRRHGLSQSRLGEGVNQPQPIISQMIKGQRLTGPQARERVVAIIRWLHSQQVLTTIKEANALLTAAGMAVLQRQQTDESELLNVLANCVGLSSQGKLTSSTASNGLFILTELMAAPEVHAAVVAFRTDFAAAREQIEILSDYKNLHDLLHTLQYYCYNNIIHEVGRFPGDEMAHENLARYELNLQDILSRLQDGTRRSSFVPGETRWIQTLMRAQHELHEALEHANPQHLEEAIRLLDQVLALQPFKINMRLNAAARTLRLPALLRALTWLRDSMVRLELDQHKMEQFESGIDDLTMLNNRLNILVNSHDRWQDLDVELRRIEASLDEDTNELCFSWPVIKVLVEPLLCDTTDAWVPGFKAATEKLNDAVLAKDHVKIKQAFWRYRSQAGMRFFQVDVDLKRLCDDLRKVGEPLAAVMRMLA